MKQKGRNQLELDKDTDLGHTARLKGTREVSKKAKTERTSGGNNVARKEVGYGETVLIWLGGTRASQQNRPGNAFKSLRGGPCGTLSKSDFYSAGA